MTLTVVFGHEADGRWIASVPELPGVHVYGGSRQEALGKAQALALVTLADEVEHGERDPMTLMTVTFSASEAA
jgi:predicted RNase H-like HicB family nuclease